MPPFANFHDMLKARVLQARQPIQIIRRSTWDETVPPPAGHSRQDEASRAWNLHVALYYKAGGAPWRLPRNPTDLTVCYIGVAFYRNSDNDSLDTSVAQVFNEHGDGVIVRGGPARVSRDDRQPHLNQDDAHALLLHALDTYHREHRTLPARVVLHKTSSFTAGEIEGFQAAADERRLDTLDMSWITSSEGGWLFRPGDGEVARLIQPVLGRVQGIEGVVLSSGALLAQGEFYGESARTEDGFYGLRRLLPAARVRETMIVPVTPRGRGQARIWRELYNAEEEWLDWALHLARLPQRDQIFGH